MRTLKILAALLLGLALAVAAPSAAVAHGSGGGSAFIHVPAQSHTGTFLGGSGNGFLLRTANGATLTLPSNTRIAVNGVNTPAYAVAPGTWVRVRTPALHGTPVAVDFHAVTLTSKGQTWTVPLSSLGRSALNSSRVWVRTPDGRTGLVSLGTALTMRNQGAVILAGDPIQLHNRRDRRSWDDNDQRRRDRGRDDDDDDEDDRGRGGDDD